ncbi:MAG TPA: flagellar basal body rod C-terminal domain-containing protein [Desulfomonilia bacterium]|nr:flagellar basal body rod C-terminal domain-containing protein [Desulfomonilia bacterium]
MSSILISALRANEILQANASSNVANMYTPDYKAINTTIVPSVDGTVDVNTTRSDEPAPLDTEGRMQSNVDAAKEFTDMMQAKTGFEAALSAISIREGMMNDLMNILTKK